MFYLQVCSIQPLITRDFKLHIVLDPNEDEICYDMSTWNETYFDLLSIGQEERSYMPKPGTTFNTAAATLHSPTSLVVTAGDRINILDSGKPSGVSTRSEPTSSRALGTIQEATESRWIGPTDSQDFINPTTFSVQNQDRKNDSASSRNSKHGQTEKYYCTDSDCKRSQSGSGFCRKDHLNQHLERKHSVPIVRGKRAAESTGPILPDRKRKRGAREKTGESYSDSLLEELKRERGWRQQADNERLTLGQKLKDCESRVQYCEERMNRMIILLEKQNGEEKVSI